MANITSENYSYVDGNDTTIVNGSESDFSEIRIHGNHGWDGVQIRYGAVSAVEQPDSDNAKLTFDFFVTNRDENTAANLEHDPGFQQYAGDILVHIITTAFEQGEYRIGPDRDDNSEESATQ